MPRAAQSVEMLRVLVDWAGGRQEFLRRTGVKGPNLSDYLQGRKRISLDRLRKCAQDMFGEPPAFRPIAECHPCEGNWPPRRGFDGVAGVYALFDSAYRLLYFGKANDLYREIRQTLGRNVKGIRHPCAGSRKLRFRGIASYVSAYEIVRGDADFRHDVEALVLRIALNSTLNQNRGRFKR